MRVLLLNATRFTHVLFLNSAASISHPAVCRPQHGQHVLKVRALAHYSTPCMLHACMYFFLTQPSARMCFFSTLQQAAHTLQHAGHSMDARPQSMYACTPLISARRGAGQATPPPGTVCLPVVSSPLPAAVLWLGRMPGVGQRAPRVLVVPCAACCGLLLLLVLFEEGCQPLAFLLVHAEDGMSTPPAGLTNVMSLKCNVYQYLVLTPDSSPS